jgi:DNA-binding PucR family transcriptional regulator
LIIRIGGICEDRDGAHREDEQGFVQAIERATRDTPAIVHKAVCFLLSLPDSCLSVSTEAAVSDRTDETHFEPKAVHQSTFPENVRDPLR